MTQPLTDLPARLRACRGVLVDSNVLLDVAQNDPVWAEWSRRAIADVLEYTTLVINPIVYAEVSVGYSSIEALDAVLPATLYQREPLPWEAGFLAAKCFGEGNSPLPDLYIGAHAAVRRLALLTRDAARYRSYFPKLEILAPGTARK